MKRLYVPAGYFITGLGVLGLLVWLTILNPLVLTALLPRVLFGTLIIFAVSLIVASLVTRSLDRTSQRLQR